MSSGFGAQAAAVRLRHPSRHVQTEPTAGRLVRAGFNEAYVRLENGLQSIGWDAWAVVGDAQLSRGAVRAKPDANLVSSAILHRVGQQVEDHLAHAVAVAAYANAPGGQVGKDSARRGERPRHLELLLNKLHQVMLANLQRQLIGRLCRTG